MDVHRGSCGLLWRLVGHSSGKSYRRLQDSQDQGSPLVGKNILTGSCLGWPKCQSRNLWDLSSNSRSSDLWLCGTFIDDAFMMHRFIASCWVTLIILFVAFPYPENIAVAIGDHDPWFKVKNTWNPFLLWSPWFWRRPWSRTLPNSTTHVTGKVMEGHRWWKIKTAVVVGGHWTHWFPPIRNMHPYNLCLPHLRTTLSTCIPRSCAFKNDENNPVFTILMPRSVTVTLLHRNRWNRGVPVGTSFFGFLPPDEGQNHATVASARKEAPHISMWNKHFISQHQSLYQNLL